MIYETKISVHTTVGQLRANIYIIDRDKPDTVAKIVLKVTFSFGGISVGPVAKQEIKFLFLGAKLKFS